MSETIPPAFDARRFTCPACEATTEHTWCNAYASPINNPGGLPLRIEGEGLEQLKQNPAFSPDMLEQKLRYWERVNAGEVFVERWAPVQSDVIVAGMELSVCQGCGHTIVWMGGKAVHGPFL